MLLDILLFGDAILRKKADEVPAVTAAVRDLAANMLETMYYHDGLGLAAPQVGVSLRLFVMDVPRDGCGKTVLVNPVIRERGETGAVEEGCLSFPGIAGAVARAAEVVVEFTDLSGKRVSKGVKGVAAQAVQLVHGLARGRGVAALPAPQGALQVVQGLVDRAHGLA